MGTSCAFARSVWVPGVSGLWVGRRVTSLGPCSSASSDLANRFYQITATSARALSVNISSLSSRSARGYGSSGRSDGSSGNGNASPHSKLLTPEGEKRRGGGPGVEKGSMKQKRSSRASRSDGLGLLADEVEDGASLEPEPYLEKSGSIHLILGPMFAGKSTALLKRAREEVSAGRRVALVKSDKDSRYGLSAVVTHDGAQMPCYAVPDLASFKAQVGDRSYREFDVIGIDEAQFFTDLYEFCLTAADYEGKTVIAAGLDGDFLRRRFGSTVDLVRVADSVVKLSSRCEICGRPAIFSFRKTLDIQTEVIGGADVYMPVCRQHYVGGQMVVDSACTVLEAHQVAHSMKDE